MANIYSGVLANMTDAFASIVSNNLNNVMRIFTIISITLSIPTLIFSMYGMNFQEGMLGMPVDRQAVGLRRDHRNLAGRFGHCHLVPDTFTHVQVESRRIARMSRLSRNIFQRRWYAPLRSYCARAGVRCCHFRRHRWSLLKGRPLRSALAADPAGIRVFPGVGERTTGLRYCRVAMRRRTRWDSRKNRSCSNRWLPSTRVSSLEDGTVDMVVDAFAADDVQNRRGRARRTVS